MHIGAPTPEAGYVDVFETNQTVVIGGDRVTVLRQLVLGDEGFEPRPGAQGERTRTVTIVL